MVKVTKSSPTSKRNEAKKVCNADYQQLTNINLTAMPFGVLSRLSFTAAGYTGGY